MRCAQSHRFVLPEQWRMRAPDGLGLDKSMFLKNELGQGRSQPTWPSSVRRDGDAFRQSELRQRHMRQESRCKRNIGESCRKPISGPFAPLKRPLALQACILWSRTECRCLGLE